MGKFIDLGEPEDVNRQVDFNQLIQKYVIFYPYSALALSCPWEEFQKIKDAIYSVKRTKRSYLVYPKENWLGQRDIEINKLRNSLYYTTLKAIGQCSSY